MECFCADLFVNITKAFGTVNCQILHSKLYDAGVKAVAFDWFSFYPTNRTPQTAVNGILSTSARLNHGIPQGSVFSGPLFLVYINELFLKETRYFCR